MMISPNSRGRKDRVEVKRNLRRRGAEYGGMVLPSQTIKLIQVKFHEIGKYLLRDSAVNGGG